MYDLSILIPDAGSDEGYYELHVDTAPDIGWAYTFLKYPSEAVKKPDTILVARKDGKPLAFAYVDKKLKCTVVSYGDASSRTMGFAKVPSLWKKPKEFDFKIYCLANYGPYSYEFVLEAISCAVLDLGIDTNLIKPTLDRDRGSALSQWLSYYKNGNYRPSSEYHITYAVYQGFGYWDYKSMFTAIKSAYSFSGKKFPTKKYDEMLDKHISLIDYLLVRVIKEKWQHVQ